MNPPVVLWWCWTAILVLAAGDLVIQGHRFVSLKLAFGALAVTGAVFACTLWPKLLTSEHGIVVVNPLRRFIIPWSAVRGIYLADSIEVQCARKAPKKDKTIYSWALSSPRRTRARARLRSWQWEQGKRTRPHGYGRLPVRAQTLTRMTTAEIMARELAALCDEARFRSVVTDVGLGMKAEGAQAADGPAGGESRAPGNDEGPAEVLSAGWCWQPLLAIVLPAIGLAISLLVG